MIKIFNYTQQEILILKYTCLTINNSNINNNTSIYTNLYDL